MAIEFVCPACGGTLRVSDGSAGRVVRCGGCMTMLRVPAAEVDPSAPASPFDTDNPAAPAPRPPANSPPPPEPVPERRARRDRDRDAPQPAPDPDRTRRRRRRSPPPPPPAGRGIFFWLVVIGAVMFLGAVGCCGGLFLLAPDAKWHKHESKTGGFKVDLPAPRHEIDRVGGIVLNPEGGPKRGRAGQGPKAEGTILARKFEEYAVAYRDLTPADLAARPALKVLDDEVGRLKEDRAVGVITREDAITVNGCPGREVEFVNTVNGGIYVVRIVVADTRVYRVFAGGQFTRRGNPNVRRFLDSFEVTDARLLAGARKRAEEAKLAAEKLREDKEREERAREDEDAGKDSRQKPKGEDGPDEPPPPVAPPPREKP